MVCVRIRWNGKVGRTSVKHPCRYTCLLPSEIAVLNEEKKIITFRKKNALNSANEDIRRLISKSDKEKELAN